MNGSTAAAPLPSQTQSALSPQETWALLALLLAVLLWQLGAFPLFDVDEGAFSEATREMLAKGDFLSTWLNGEPRFDKPILVYWLQAASVHLFGVTEWAFRLPSALSTVVWCMAIATFAAPRWGRSTAWLAAVTAVTSAGVFGIGRAATADALLNALLTLTMFDCWRFIESERAWFLRRAFVWMGLGLLAKGPVAALIPLATTFLYYASVRRLGTWVKAIFDPWGIALALLIALPWYITAYAIHGQAFIDGFLLKHNVDRFSGPLEGHSGSVLYYVAVLPLLLLPWSWALIDAVVQGVKGRSARIADAASVKASARFLWIWSGFVIVFFSFSGTKLPHYVLYGSSPLFVLMAAALMNRHSAWPVSVPALGLMALVASLPAVFQRLNEQHSVADPFYAQQLLTAAEKVPAHYTWATGVLLVLGAALALTSRLSAQQRMAGMALLSTFTVSTLGLPYLADVLQGSVKRGALYAKSHLEAGESVVLWNCRNPSFSVYREQITQMTTPEKNQIALTRPHRIPPDRQYEVLWTEGGLALVRLK